VRYVSRFLLLALGLLLFAGCATNYYNVPRETYEKKVKVLGVAPILLDTDAEIRHPEKGEVLRIVREANRKNERELVDMLKSNGDYSAVRFLEEDPEQLYAGLAPRRERRDDAGVVYNKYFYKQEELKRLITKHNVDALMLVTVSGITMLEKIYANIPTSYLEDNYNSLIMTAQILDANGTLLWEYPNFRQKILSYSKLFDLQYADFEEARANLTDQVRIKNKSIPGIERAFAKSESSSVKSIKQVSVLYNKQFAAISSLLHYFRNPFEEKKVEKQPEAAVTPIQDEYAPRTATPVSTVPPPSLPLAPPPAAAAPVTPPAPAAAPVVAPAAPPAASTAVAAPAPAVKPVKREFEPIAPLEPVKGDTQVIKEPVIK
jgi:hypothetical protein